MLIYLFFLLQMQQTAFFYRDPLENIRDYRSFKTQKDKALFVHH